MPFLIQLSHDDGRLKLYVVAQYVETEEDDDGNLTDGYELKHFETIADALPLAFTTAEEAALFLAKVKVPSPATTVAEVIEVPVH